jgi:FKBP-type peptidyl-prolyl cis-trans isomerase
MLAFWKIFIICVILVLIMKSIHMAIIVGVAVLIGLHFMLDKPLDTKGGQSTTKLTAQAEVKGITTKSIKTMDVTKLIIEDEKVGTGAEAKAGDSVTVHYVGTLLDGTLFDASRNHGDTGFTFTLGAGQVIKGWDQGVAGMKVGGKRKLTIPADLAYGSRAIGNVIPANSPLQFEVELLKVGN